MPRPDACRRGSRDDDLSRPAMKIAAPDRPATPPAPTPRATIVGLSFMPRAKLNAALVRQ